MRAGASRATLGTVRDSGTDRASAAMVATGNMTERPARSLVGGHRRAQARAEVLFLLLAIVGLKVERGVTRERAVRAND
eukprot:scaffold20025_cov149-Isochrysis_galbana.AAC.1